MARTSRRRSPPTKRSRGLALFCCAEPLTDLVLEVKEVRKSGDIRIRKLPCRIESIDKPAPDVAIVKIKLPANERLQFLAGQYIDLLLKDGRRRSFSLATAPHDDALLELHVRHVPGGHFTQQLFNEYRGREILRFEGPLGTFFLREESDKPILFVAGGTGFAPIKGIIEHALYRQIDATRPMVLYLGSTGEAGSLPARSAGHMATAEPQLHVHTRAVRSRCRETIGTVASASCTRRCSTISPTCPVTRSTPAAVRPWSTRAQELRRHARAVAGRLFRRQLHLCRAAGRGRYPRSNSASASLSAAASCAFASESRLSRANSSPSATRVRQASATARLASK
jgi:CDP-4-dehydro-6-deoxyglucose reductase